MKYYYLPILLMVVFLLSSCSIFYPKQSESAPVMQQPKPLVTPLGKNWQLKEEAPKLSDNTGRLPFQTEQSMQPDGGVVKPASPEEKRRIEMSH